MYGDRDIYLLDDPLSAVDAEVGRHIYRKVVRGLLRKKAVLLVTHQVQHLSDATEVIFLREGRVEGRGDYASVMAELSAGAGGGDSEWLGKGTTSILEEEPVRVSSPAPFEEMEEDEGPLTQSQAAALLR